MDTNYINNQNHSNDDLYNQQLNNNDNISQLTNNSSSNKNKKSLIIIISIIVILIIIFSSLFIKGNHKNNTGSSEYNSKDVDLNCTYTSDDKTVIIYSDLIFNYKSTGKESYNYLLKKYNKRIDNYPDGLTDEKYNNFINKNFSAYCGGFTGIDCKSSHLELGITDLGWDTIVDRTRDKIIITYSNIYGIGQTATKEDISEIKKTYEEENFKCY